ncbi:MAG: pilus assembly protein [Sphingomonas bacterium]|nr:pilus assembly protein [Sphingomonas bacterium]
MRRFLTLWREQRGAAIIELAIVAPVIALMTVGVVDLSNGFGNKLKLEQAAQRSIEKVMQTTGITSVETTIVNEAVCQFNGTNADGSCKTAPITAANVTVTHRLECNGVLSALEDCATGQVESRWIQVSIWTDYEPMFALNFSGIDGNGKYRLVAKAGLRTE